MLRNKYVDEYIAEIKANPQNFNKERIDLITYLEAEILPRDDLYYFNETQIENYKRWTETLFFTVEPFQMFMTAFVFLYHKSNHTPVFDTFFLTMSRGAGKNGYISSLSSFLTSELHGIEGYNVVVVANSEKQAKTSFIEVYNTLLKHNLQNTAEHKGLFEVFKSIIRNVKTKSEFSYSTSNAKTADGRRDGAVVFDEIHEYEDSRLVDVFTSGLGKVDNPRRFFIGTNGYVREGYYDKLMEQSHDVLKTHENPQQLFPFICTLDSLDEVDDYSKWQKCQPMFAEPMSQYGERLFDTYKKAYLKIPSEPSSRQEFMIKRMNLPEEDLEHDVASIEELRATNQPIPYEELEGADCIGGVDFGSVRDFTAVGLLFKTKEEKLVWITHSFARLEYLKKANLKPPIFEWEKEGLLTVVDEPTINPNHVVEWFKEQAQKYKIKKIEIDSYKADLICPLLTDAGFEVELIRKPSSIHPRLAPLVETAFASNQFVWGDNPLMRWYSNNVYVKTLKDGGKQYLKKDEHRHKTDGFQALLHALSRVNELDTVVDVKSSLKNMIKIMKGAQ